MESKFHRILIVRTDRIGDVILTLPMAHVLRKHFPQAHIAMLSRFYTAELIEDNADVDCLIFYDDGRKPIPFFRLISKLRDEKFDLVFHTHPRFRLALVTWLARIPVRVGTGYRWYSFLFSKKVYEHRKDAKYHELEYNLHLIDALGCPPVREKIVPVLRVQEEAMRKVKNLLAASGIEEGCRIVILHPGSGRSARDWSAGNFGSLGRRLAELPRVKIVITGGTEEESLVREVQSTVGPSAVTFAKGLTLREFGALAKEASLFIANSTGPLHIAAAAGTFVIGLYPQVTALSARRWSPYTENKTILSPLNKPADCKKCLRGKKRSCECMESITVDEVYQAAYTQLVKDVPRHTK